MLQKFSQVAGGYTRLGRRSVLLLMLVSLFVGLGGCVTARHGGALHNAVTLKGETLALMSKATEPYATHQGEIASLDSRLEAAFDLERTRPANEPTIKMWDTLLHANPELPGSGIYLRFKQQWQAKSTLRPAYIENKKSNVGSAFDSIISLERAKPQ